MLRVPLVRFHGVTLPAALIAIFIISFLYESFSAYVSKFSGPPVQIPPRNMSPFHAAAAVCNPSFNHVLQAEQKSLDDSNVPLLAPGLPRQPAPKHTLHRAQGAVLHALHCFYSYNLMLLAMTYNIGVVVAICCGLGLGFYWHRYGRSAAQSPCH